MENKSKEDTNEARPVSNADAIMEILELEQYEEDRQDGNDDIIEDERAMMILVAWLCMCEANLPSDMYTNLMSTPTLKNIMSVVSHQQLQLAKCMFTNTMGERKEISVGWSTQVLSVVNNEEIKFMGKYTRKDGWFLIIISLLLSITLC